MVKSALEQIFAQAGLRKSVYREVNAALRAAAIPGGSQDDVAGALLRWKDRACIGAAAGRDAAWRPIVEDALNPSARKRQLDAINASNRHNDDPAQMTLEDVLGYDGPAPF